LTAHHGGYAMCKHLQLLGMILPFRTSRQDLKASGRLAKLAVGTIHNSVCKSVFAGFGGPSGCAGGTTVFAVSSAQLAQLLVSF